MKNLKLFTAISILAFVASTGCGKGSSFSLLGTGDSFKQSDGTANSKVDILWVMDNSGSMESSQQNVVNNLNSFIQDFSTTQLDFKMAVTTTDAYRVQFTNNHNCSKFRDGIRNSNCNSINGRTYSGQFVLTPATLNLSSTFLINASLTDSANNIYGSGDERAFQSIKAALDESQNAGFIRPDSFVSIIIVSDEDDFSNGTANLHEDYNYAGLHTVQSYVDYLDTATGSIPTNRRYNVNAMAIFDNACLTALNASFSGRKIGSRYSQLVESVNTAFVRPETKGLKTSLCGNFADDLKNISNNILSLASRFKLQRLPKPETIAVKVDGVVVPNVDTNPLADGGWAYEEASNSVLFISTKYIPPKGANIMVTYDPLAYGQ